MATARCARRPERRVEAGGAGLVVFVLFFLRAAAVRGVQVRNSGNWSALREGRKEGRGAGKREEEKKKGRREEKREGERERARERRE